MLCSFKTTKSTNVIPQEDLGTEGKLSCGERVCGGRMICARLTPDLAAVYFSNSAFSLEMNGINVIIPLLLCPSFSAYLVLPVLLMGLLVSKA